MRDQRLVRLYKIYKLNGSSSRGHKILFEYFDNHLIGLIPYFRANSKNFSHYIHPDKDYVIFRYSEEFNMIDIVRFFEFWETSVFDFDLYSEEYKELIRFFLVKYYKIEKGVMMFISSESMENYTKELMIQYRFRNH